MTNYSLDKLNELGKQIQHWINDDPVKKSKFDTEIKSSEKLFEVVSKEATGKVSIETEKYGQGRANSCTDQYTVEDNLSSTQIKYLMKRRLHMLAKLQRK